jgi:hypothetical protein
MKIAWRPLAVIFFDWHPKRRLVLVLVGAALLSGLTWALLHWHPAESEPVYKGKTLSAWLAVYDPANTNRPASQLLETETAVLQMGTNAIPALLRMLRSPDPHLKRILWRLAQKQNIIHFHYVPPASVYERAAMGLEVLGPRAESAVPELVNIFESNLSPESQGTIARVLGLMGPLAKPAVPALLRGIVSTNSLVSQSSIWAVRRIDPEAAGKAGIN